MTNKIILPKSVYVAESPQSNQVNLVSVEEVPENKMILDIELNEEIIPVDHEYIIWNGAAWYF